MVVAWLRKFAVNVGGGFAVNIGMLSPVLLGAVAGTVDYLAYANHKFQLQNAADAAAIAAVREAAIEGWNRKTAHAIADAVVSANLGLGQGDKTSAEKILYKTVAEPDEENRSIKVTVSQDYYPYFAARVFPSPQISVTAKATSAGSDN
ncbi:MAG: pilus assembly protein TadG-related protein, partial [Pseudomonadota bacterium]